MEEKDYNELDSSNEEKKVKRKNIDKEKNKKIDTHFINTDDNDAFILKATPFKFFISLTPTAGIVPMIFLISWNNEMRGSNYVLYIVMEALTLLVIYLLPILLLIRIRNRYDSYNIKQKKKWKILSVSSLIFSIFIAWFMQGFLPRLRLLLLIIPLAFIVFLLMFEIALLIGIRASNSLE